MAIHDTKSYSDYKTQTKSPPQDTLIARKSTHRSYNTKDLLTDRDHHFDNESIEITALALIFQLSNRYYKWIFQIIRRTKEVINKLLTFNK